MKIGLIACSNGIKDREKYEEIKMIIEKMDVKIVEADTIFRVEGHIYSGSPQKRATELNRLFSMELDYIIDVSGGDSGNEILDYLDYEKISKSKAVYAGYSDLSTVINALLCKSKKWSYYYNIWNIVGDDRENQIKYFKEIFINDNFDQSKLEIEIGEWIGGEIFGGNLRCFSKLIGTDYLPDGKDKLFLIEAWSGNEARLRTYLYQMKQGGVFKDIKGIILGNFTDLEKEKNSSEILKIVEDISEIKDIVKLSNLGHNSNSYTIKIGK